MPFIRIYGTFLDIFDRFIERKVRLRRKKVVRLVGEGCGPPNPHANKALIIMVSGSHILSRDSLFSLINGQEVNPKPRV